VQNFFQVYYEYVKKTEPPPVYHAWSAVGAICALLGKKCFVPQGHFTVWPNLYIVLVGTAGMRKTTAMSIAKSIVRKVERVKIAPDAPTREALIDEMAKSQIISSYLGKDNSYWQASAFVSELEQFLGGKHINQSMIGFMTAIWDEIYFRERTRKGGEVIINNPFFSLLGCCTTEWMATKLKQDVISDGFSRRTIFVLGETNNPPNPWPEADENEEEYQRLFGLEAERIHGLNGRFKLTEQALDLYCRRYLGMRDEAKAHSEKIATYFSSKHVLVLKVAMCICSGVSSNMIIDSGMMRAAFAFLDDSERHLDKVYSGVGRNELKAYADQILTRIRKSPNGLTMQEIVASAFDDLRKPEIEEALATMEQAGYLSVAIDTTAAGTPRYVATTTTLAAGGTDLLDLVRRLEPLNEPVAAKTATVFVPPPLAPATERLLARQAQKANDAKAGLLLRGTTGQAG
jgi:hypothetical protein